MEELRGGRTPQRPVGMTPSIDAHVHLWTRSTDPQTWIDATSMGEIDRDFTTADLVAMLAESAATSAIVVQSSNSATETERLLMGAVEAPGHPVAGVVGWIDLTIDVRRQLEGLSSELRAMLVGVRHLTHIDPDPMWLLRPDVGRGLTALGAAELAVDLVVRWWQLPQVMTIVRSHPDVTFVIDHLGGPPVGTPDLDEWGLSIRRLADHDNVVVKVSGVADSLWSGGSVLDAYRPVFESALAAFGADRLMYGSDWPLVELVGGVGVWRDVVGQLTEALNASERALLLGGTAARAYRLSGA